MTARFHAECTHGCDQPGLWESDVPLSKARKDDARHQFENHVKAHHKDWDLSTTLGSAGLKLSTRLKRLADITRPLPKIKLRPEGVPFEPAVGEIGSTVVWYELDHSSMGRLSSPNHIERRGQVWSKAGWKKAIWVVPFEPWTESDGRTVLAVLLTPREKFVDRRWTVVWEVNQTTYRKRSAESAVPA